MSRSAGWNHRFGAAAEELAVAHLERSGCRVLDRRYRWKGGEIDLVVRDGRVLAFVEVKARTGAGFGAAAAAVTARKRRRIWRTAARWLGENGPAGGPCRFDVVCVEAGDGRARVRWIRDAFRG